MTRAVVSFTEIQVPFEQASAWFVVFDKDGVEVYSASGSVQTFPVYGTRAPNATKEGIALALRLGFIAFVHQKILDEAAPASAELTIHDEITVV